jgi:2-dehydropantoate 2-reductase
LKALSDAGLRVDSPNGDLVLASVAATDDPSAVGTVDAVLVCVKTWQVPEVVEAIRPLIGADTVILPLENGVEAANQLAVVYGDDHVLGGMCRIMSKIVEPGHIAHVGIEPFVALGELDNRPSERVGRLAGVLERAGITVETPADIHAAIWGKFLFIASFSGVGAVTRSPVGQLRSVTETRGMVESAMREIHSVAAANGIELGADAVSRTMAFMDALPAEGTSSMQRDILEGRPSELEAHSGAVVRLGKEDEVPTPTHEFIYAALLPMEIDARRDKVSNG